MRPADLVARLGRARFPLAAPTWPGGVPRPAPERKVGLDYDHEWSRRYPVRLARAVVLDNVTRPVAKIVAPTTVRGIEHLRHLEGPVIFAANHASHVDTPLLLTTLPLEFRHRTVVAAASDYFFDRTWKAVLWSFSLAAIPIERSKVNRRSADTAAELLEDGWNLVIFPEGGRSPDGWTQPFRGGAAYLARRTGRPVVPVYLHGTRHVAASRSGRPADRRAARAPRPGAGAACGAPRSPWSSGRPCRRAKGRTPGASAPGWRARWPCWPTRWPPTGGPPGAGRRPGRARRPGVLRPRPGAGPGPSAPPPVTSTRWPASGSGPRSERPLGPRRPAGTLRPWTTAHSDALAYRSARCASGR